MIATSTVRRGARPASSSCIARSELMPGMPSADSSSNCQFRGRAATCTAGTRVGCPVATGSAGADAFDGAGAGEVATVAGAPQAAAATKESSAIRTDSDMGAKSWKKAFTNDNAPDGRLAPGLTRFLRRRCQSRICRSLINPPHAGGRRRSREYRYAWMLATGGKRRRTQSNDAGASRNTHTFRSMSPRSDHTALVVLGAIGVLGAGVRVVRASPTFTHDRQPALERQMQVADSSAKVIHAPKSRAAPRRAGVRASTDSVRKSYGAGPLDRPGYVNGKLDLDVATAAQIDSLPGVSTMMAKRIVADRMRRGPFVTREALRRVSGAGPIFIARLDSLV